VLLTRWRKVVRVVVHVVHDPATSESEPQAGISGFLSRVGAALRDVAINIYFLIWDITHHVKTSIAMCAADRCYKPCCTSTTRPSLLLDSHNRFSLPTSLFLCEIPTQHCATIVLLFCRIVVIGALELTPGQGEETLAKFVRQLCWRFDCIVPTISTRRRVAICPVAHDVGFND
jgi:hypothetical protein